MTATDHSRSNEPPNGDTKAKPDHVGGFDRLPDRRYLLHNVTAGTDQLFKTEQDALDAVNEQVFSGDSWTIVLVPARISGGYQIHSGHGPI